MSIPSWAKYMLDNYSPGMLQAGYLVTKPRRIRNREIDGHWQIVPDYKRVRGTGIPASTMAKFKSGEWTPGEKTLVKLSKAYRRFVYNDLRSVGASVSEAKRLTTYNVNNTMHALDVYREQAEEMSDEWDIPYEEMIWSMWQSEMTVDDWEMYTKAESA